MGRFSREGFTLIELMIVVMIVALLAALAIPIFETVRENVVGGVLIRDARQLANAAEQYFLEQAVESVPISIDDGGVISGPLSAYVKQVSEGTKGPDLMTVNASFTMSHPLFEDDSQQEFTAEGTLME